jgi:hypothetical protein
VEVVAVKANGNLPGANLGINIKKTKSSSKVAVCVPSNPSERWFVRQEGQDMVLREWWEEWSNNIASSFPVVSNMGPIFLVLEELNTETFINAYYTGDEKETKVAATGTLHNAKLTLRAGFKWIEDGSFGFKGGSRIEGDQSLAGQKWTIFIKSQKFMNFRFKRLKPWLKYIWWYVPTPRFYNTSR